MPTGTSTHADEPRPGRRERLRLCDLFTELGADAETLCEGWSSHDLAAHLVVREAVPQAAPGLVVPRLHGITEHYQRSARQRPYTELVAAIRNGPPRLSLLGLPVFRELGNIHESFVHHEDLRRPAGLGPRHLEGDLDSAVWTRLRFMGPRLSRGLRSLRVEARAADGRSAILHDGGRGRLTLRGECGELLLYLFNRRSAAVVEVEGDADGLRVLSQVRLGL